MWGTNYIKVWTAMHYLKELLLTSPHLAWGCFANMVPGEYPVLFVKIWWKSVIDIKLFYQLFTWIRLKQMNICLFVIILMFWTFSFHLLLCDFMMKFRSYFYPLLFSCQWERQERKESKIIFHHPLNNQRDFILSFSFVNALMPRTGAASFMNRKELLFMDWVVFLYLCILNIPN